MRISKCIQKCVCSKLCSCCKYLTSFKFWLIVFTLFQVVYVALITILTYTYIANIDLGINDLTMNQFGSILMMLAITVLLWMMAQLGIGWHMMIALFHLSESEDMINPWMLRYQHNAYFRYKIPALLVEIFLRKVGGGSQEDAWFLISTDVTNTLVFTGISFLYTYKLFLCTKSFNLEIGEKSNELPGELKLFKNATKIICCKFRQLRKLLTTKTEQPWIVGFTRFQVHYSLLLCAFCTIYSFQMLMAGDLEDINIVPTIATVFSCIIIMLVEYPIHWWIESVFNKIKKMPKNLDSSQCTNFGILILKFFSRGILYLNMYNYLDVTNQGWISLATDMTNSVLYFDAIYSYSPLLLKNQPETKNGADRPKPVQEV